MLNAIIDPLKDWAASVVGQIGYPGIFGLMLLDSANIPIPSEVTMPTGGFAAHRGELNLHLVALAGTFGSLLGSLINYWIGAALGKEFLLKYGKYMLLRPKELEHAEKWYDKYGLGSTLWGRWVPLARTFISLPAGLYRAPLRPFIIYTFIGSLVWCYLWTVLGYFLEKHWSVVESNMHYIDLAVVAILGFLIARFIFSRLKQKPETESP